MNNWSNEDIKRKRLIQVNGGAFVKSEKLVNKKVVKIAPSTNSFGINPYDAILDVREDTPVTIFIKPLSTNKAWKGRRSKTDEHKNYCVAVSCLLPKGLVIPDGLLKAYYEFGLSSRGADYDNNVKSLQDIISKKYGFNDNRIMEANIKKVIVPKGKEYITFKFEKL